MPFAVTTGHQRSYCSQYCGHLESLRKTGGRRQNMPRNGDGIYTRSDWAGYWIAIKVLTDVDVSARLKHRIGRRPRTCGAAMYRGRKLPRRTACGLRARIPSPTSQPNT